MLTVLFWLYVVVAVISGALFVHYASGISKFKKYEYTDWRRHVEKYLLYVAYVLAPLIFGAFWPLTWLWVYYFIKNNREDNQTQEDEKQ